MRLKAAQGEKSAPQFITPVAVGNGPFKAHGFRQRSVPCTRKRVSVGPLAHVTLGSASNTAPHPLRSDLLAAPAAVIVQTWPAR